MTPKHPNLDVFHLFLKVNHLEGEDICNDGRTDITSSSWLEISAASLSIFSVSNASLLISKTSCLRSSSLTRDIVSSASTTPERMPSAPLGKPLPSPPSSFLSLSLPSSSPRLTSSFPNRFLSFPASPEPPFVLSPPPKPVPI